MSFSKKLTIAVILALLISSLAIGMLTYLRIPGREHDISALGQDVRNLSSETSGLKEEVNSLARNSQVKPLLIEYDKDGTGYSEVSQLISFKGKLYAFIAPKGHIVAVDPLTLTSEVVYEHPYIRPDKWRATAWGAYVTEEGVLFFAGWGSDEQKRYCSYIFKTTDGENFTAIKLGEDAEAYSIVEFENSELGIKKLFVFVADFFHNETVVLSADPLGEHWTEVYRFSPNYKIGGAIEWYGDLWAAGSSDEPGMPSSNGVIVHYDPQTDSWEKFTYNVGFYAIGRYFMGPERRVLLGDTDGWLWVTYTMPPPQNKDRRLVKLDAPVMRINWLGDWHLGNSSQLMVSTGLRWGWGSLWLIDSSVFAHRLVQNAYGGISAFTPLYNGIAYATAWDLPGVDYDVRPHALGGKYLPSASVDLITTREIANQTGKGREPLRHVITWEDEDKEAGKVKADAYSDMVPGIGWQEFVLNFTADVDGILTIEVDTGIDPENPYWRVLEEIDVKANQPVAQKLEVLGLRHRVSFSNTAMVSAVAYLYP